MLGSSQDRRATVLIQNGADVVSRDNDERCPFTRKPEGQVEIAELLIQHGADVISRDSKNSTPLHTASQQGHVKIK